MINKKYCKIWENIDANIKKQYLGKPRTCFLACRTFQDELIELFSNQ